MTGAIWNGRDGLERRGGEGIEGKRATLKKNIVGKQVKLWKNKLEREQSLKRQELKAKLRSKLQTKTEKILKVVSLRLGVVCQEGA